MTSTHKVPKKITAILAVAFLLPALYIFGLWMKVFSQDVTPAQKVVEFTDHFPASISDYKIIMYTSMACCLIAMVLAAKSFKQRLLSLRITMWLIVMIASLIFLLDVFQLF
ncbi:MAG: hypothetical protein JWO92_2146 [Chitinophagaceae bacterium]|nr:hypothetical protein [Chitinophagaceae bacterium]MDB5223579.1 hypothetical protein [Chitinophagaceae bacterium]